jgi:hypothetical protein
MDAKWEEIDLKFGPNGTTLDDGSKLLRSIINELMLIRMLTKKFEITMKTTASYTPYVKILLMLKSRSSCADTKASISKRNLDIIHGNQNLRRVRNKKRTSRILYCTKKSSSILYNNYKFRKSGAVQQQQAASYR